MAISKSDWQAGCTGHKVNWAGSASDNQTVGQRLDGLASRVAAAETKAAALKVSFDAAILRLDAAVAAMNLLSAGLGERIEAAVAEALENQPPPASVSPALLTEQGDPISTEDSGRLLTELS